MNAPVRLGFFGIGLVVLFVTTFLVARAVAPPDWSATANPSAPHGGQDSGDHGQETTTRPVRGLSMEQDGYQLYDLRAADQIGRDGTLSFALRGPDGKPLVAYETSHEKTLHLVVVRSDGRQFRHVHPTHDGAGRWSLPWTWREAGSYRVFADFVPEALGRNVTLTGTIHIGGRLTAANRPIGTAASVAGYRVELDGRLRAGQESALALAVTRRGKPVTLQPYLGSYGHLVALREGDLGYLHVHPADEAGNRTAPTKITFLANAPTAGRYLLYLDFQVAGRVHTAEFAVTAS